MKIGTALTIGIGILALMPYVFNGVKFFNCDFESDYRCEVIHGIGVAVPPSSWVTVWFDDDAEK